jgi:hypothetical protein
MTVSGFVRFLAGSRTKSEFRTDLGHVHERDRAVTRGAAIAVATDSHHA